MRYINWRFTYSTYLLTVRLPTVYWSYTTSSILLPTWPFVLLSSSLVCSIASHELQPNTTNTSMWITRKLTMCCRLAVDSKLPGTSGITRIWCEERRGTKLRESNLRFKDDTQKYYKIHAENTDKAIDLHTVLLDSQPHEVDVRCLNIWSDPPKLKSWKEIEGGTCPSAP